MMFNKKGQIGTVPVNKLLNILLKIAILVVIMSIILLWAKPAFGKVAEWISFW